MTASWQDRRTANEFGGAHAQCRECGQAANRADVADLGGMCGGCFARYCRGTGPVARMSADDRRAVAARLSASVGASKPSPREWAAAILARRDRGEQVSKIAVEIAQRMLPSKQAGDVAPAPAAVGDVESPADARKAAMAADPRFAAWVAAEPAHVTDDEALWAQQMAEARDEAA